VRITIRPKTDPAVVAGKTVAALRRGDVVWERKRVSMPVIAAALQLVLAERPDVTWHKWESGGEVLVTFSVSDSKAIAYATGRKVAGEAA
jgi:hypothetical protein